jgi:NAD+ kinase
VPHIGLISRDGSAVADAARAEAQSWLTAHGRSTRVVTRNADRASLSGLELILAFGGDGTLLGAAHAVALAGLDIPVLGVNLGHLGFLTEVSRAEMLDALQAVLDGRTRTESRLMLHGRVDRGGQIVAERLALNDIVVTRGALSRMIEVDVAVDDLPVTHIKADGVIIATATGSTAYNLSAGGPIVLPSLDVMVLTPIAPHALSNRPLVLPATASVVLKPVIEPQEDLVATFDGQFGLSLQPGDAVVVTRADRVVKLLRVTQRSHFDMLREKLRWG